MERTLTDDNPNFLSTLPAAANERRIALIVVFISAAAFAIALPFAKVQLAKLWAFIPVYQSALIVNDLITSALLFGQFYILRAHGLLLLASGYLFTALMAVAHLLTFPELFAPTGLLGASPQTTAWLYMFWHGGFPLLVIAYALSTNKPNEFRSARASTAILISIGAVLIAVTALTSLATAGQTALPPIMQGNRYTPAMIIVVGSVWALSGLAQFALWRRRPHSVLDIWLMVTMWAWIFDIALAAVFNGGRFDFGFYAGRLYGLLAASFVLVVMLLETIGMYARLTDAHRRERRQSAELKAANDELEAYSYSISHDLRAPLRRVDGYAQVLLDDYRERLDNAGREILDTLRTNSQRMQQLINDLLEFSRFARQPVQLQPVSLNELVTQTISELRPSDRQIDFSVGALGTVQADPALLKQVLVNLLSNAIKFTRQRTDANIEIGCQLNANATTTYYVRDNGAGFDMLYADKLFGVFQRLHRADEFEGTGVGLAIVQRIIQRHGGHIWADSKPMAGTTFYFTLADAVPTDAAEKTAHNISL